MFQNTDTASIVLPSIDYTNFCWEPRADKLSCCIRLLTLPLSPHNKIDGDTKRLHGNSVSLQGCVTQYQAYFGGGGGAVGENGLSNMYSSNQNSISSTLYRIK